MGHGSSGRVCRLPPGPFIIGQARYLSPYMQKVHMSEKPSKNQVDPIDPACLR